MNRYTQTDCPAVSPEDIEAMRVKYRQERDRRIKQDHGDQYIAATGAWAEIYEVDPYTPMAPREPIESETDLVVLGGGYCGMMVAVQLKRAGLSNFKIVDHGGDFGGTWYWNRYPGIQCDTDAYCYMPLLEETGYMPTKKFADGHEIEQHCKIIAETFDLYPHALFHTLVQSLEWDEKISRWIIGTNRGDKIKARFVVMAHGPLNKPKLPGIPGINKFKGKLFHTARWDYDYTGGEWGNPVLSKLSDKRVAIIGTGATAVQVVPYLGKYAKQVYVIQRTPPCVDQRNNRPTDPEWIKTLKPGWQEERIRNFHHGAVERFWRGEPDMIQDIWTEVNRNLCAELERQGWPDISSEEYAQRHEVMDYRVMARLRRRCDEIVKDPATAEALKPYYRFKCKRPTSNDEYLQTFNRPNVKLIDVSDTQGLEELTETGFIHHGQHYEIDCLIFASGYEVTTDLDRRWGIKTITGRKGLSIYDYWREGFKTFQGIMAHNFPNMFFTGFTQSAANAANSKTLIDQGFHIGYIASEALKRGATMVEPTQEAQSAYIRHLRSIAIDNSAYVEACTPSYFNNEGDPSKKRHFFGEPWCGGYYEFQDMLRKWRDAGTLEGIAMTENALEQVV